MDEQVVLVNLVVKAPDKDTARQYVTRRMQDWFDELTDNSGVIDGSLMLWNFYTPKVVNGE